MSVNLDPRPGDPFPLTTHLLQKITELERENAALHTKRGALLVENADLCADKERLDWILNGEGASWIHWHREIGAWPQGGDLTRERIDAARKEQG